MMNKLVMRGTMLQTLLAKRPTMLPMAAKLFNTSNLGQVVNNFYARGEAEEVTIAGVSKTMGEILKTHISFNEHQQYHPVAEELTYYVVKLLEQHKKPFVSNQNARIFIDFGTSFDIQDREYWNVVIASFLETIQDLKSKDLLSVVSQLKQFGLLNSQVIQQTVTILREQVQVLTTPELVIFTMIYTSPDSRSVNGRDSNFEEKLDFILSKHIEHINADEFASVCNTSVSLIQQELGEHVLFQSFLKESVQQADQWLEENSFSLSDLASVTFAYGQILDSLDADKAASFKAKVEQCILYNAKNLKVNEAVNLLQGVHEYASAAVTEVLDRIIGGNIDQVPVENLIPTLKAFLSNETSRPKILNVLMKQIKENVDEFTLRELCDLSLLLREFGNSYEGVYELIEPYILSKINSLTEIDILMAIRGFYNPDLSKKFKIINVLESMVIDQAGRMNKDNLKDLLQFYTENRMGSRILIETLLAHTESKQ